MYYDPRIEEPWVMLRFVIARGSGVFRAAGECAFALTGATRSPPRFLRARGKSDWQTCRFGAEVVSTRLEEHGGLCSESEGRRDLWRYRWPVNVAEAQAEISASRHACSVACGD